MTIVRCIISLLLCTAGYAAGHFMSDNCAAPLTPLTLKTPKTPPTPTTFEGELLLGWHPNGDFLLMTTPLATPARLQPILVDPLRSPRPDEKLVVLGTATEKMATIYADGRVDLADGHTCEEALGRLHDIYIGAR